MNTKSFIFAICLSVTLFSCSDEQDYFPTDTANQAVEEKAKSHAQSVVSFSDAKLFISSIPTELFNQGMATKSTEEKIVESMTPIIENSDTLLWVVNYENDNGFLILSADRNRFPIVGFNDEGKFETDRSINTQLDEMIDLLIASRKIASTDNTNTYSEFWQEITNLEEGEEITIEILSNDDTEPVGTRSIPERDKPIGRWPVFPLCYPVEWGTGFGYHYEMFRDLYGGYKKPIDRLVVSLGHIMYRYWFPHKYDWMRMPYRIEQIAANDRSNAIASMFKDISDQLGITPVRPSPLASQIYDIPSFFRANGYSNPGEMFLYEYDENSFMRVYNSLLRGNPVLFVHLFQPNGKSRSWRIDDRYDRIQDAFVVDGYQEVRVKVTITKRFLGIKVSTKEYFYYADYFRFLFPHAGNFRDRQTTTHGYRTGWFKQDFHSGEEGLFLLHSRKDGRRYAFTNIRP